MSFNEKANRLFDTPGKFFKFTREVFSEDGQGSFSRVTQGVIVAAVLGWITYLVHKNGAMPDLGGPSVFIGTAGAAHYGLNKATDIITALKGNGNGNS